MHVLPFMFDFLIFNFIFFPFFFFPTLYDTIQMNDDNFLGPHNRSSS